MLQEAFRQRGRNTLSTETNGPGPVPPNVRYTVTKLWALTLILQVLTQVMYSRPFTLVVETNDRGVSNVRYINTLSLFFFRHTHTHTRAREREDLFI